VSAFPADPRVRHFYDPQQRAGKAVARSLGAEEGAVAWDIYLFYKPGSQWMEHPPLPDNWLHQLTGARWAGFTYYRRGDDLMQELCRLVHRLAV
jgi:hypothetical protein